MNAEIAQLVALTGHGNQFLFGHRSHPPDLEESNTTFQYVGGTRFETEGELIDGAESWFEWLSSHDVSRLSLRLAGSVAPLAGFSGATGGAVISHSDGPDLKWRPVWDFREDAPADRPWFVAFRSTTIRNVADELTLQDAREALDAALQTAESVARAERSLFQESFRDARELLTADDPVPPYHTDMLPPLGYSLEARQVLAAATQAWVFGGMGSWNDFMPKDEDRYQEARRMLYGAVNRAFVAAANSFDGSQNGSCVL